MKPSFNNNEIHVWRIVLDRQPDRVAHYETLISEKEREKAAHAKVPGIKEDRIIAAGALREVLSHYLKIDPQKIEYSYGEQGKPYIHGSDVYFNISHTQGLLLIAVTTIGQVGIDVECVNRTADLREITQRYFTKNESAALFSLNEADFQKAFCRCWTQKEAFVKASGVGLLRALNSFEVSVGENEPKLLSIEGDTLRAKEWSLLEIDIGEAYIATVAIRAQQKNFSICIF